MTPPCCQPPGPRDARTLGLVATDLARVLFATLTLCLLPKCPVCLAAYVAFFTGLSLTTTTAGHLHEALVWGCGYVVTMVLLRSAMKLRRGKRTIRTA